MHRDMKVILLECKCFFI